MSLRQTAKGENVKNEDEFREKKIQLYKETLNFIDVFKQSRHPNTTFWLVEILHILTNKFPPSPSMNKVASNLTKQMERQLQFLLEASAAITEDACKLDFDGEEYQLSDVHLSPTVYELLKRFEFSQQTKSETEITQDQET